jgi:hypothetical protein
MIRFRDVATAVEELLGFMEPTCGGKHSNVDTMRRSSPIGKLSKSPPDWGSTALFVPSIFALSWLVHRTRCHDGVGLSGPQER